MAAARIPLVESEVSVAAIQRIGSPAASILDEALEASGFWNLLSARCATIDASELTIAIKPDLDIFIPGSVTGTDPTLVEALIVRLRGRGYANVTVCDGRNRRDDWLMNREALCVPDLVGYRFEAPEGEPYDVVFSDDDADTVVLDAYDTSGALQVNGAWTRADVRISFAKAKTDDGWGYALTAANLLGLVSTESVAAHWTAEDRALNLLRRVPPDFALIDAVQASHGPAGSRVGRPISLDTIIASPSALLCDWATALKMGVDPHISPPNHLSLEVLGLPRSWSMVGDTAPWPGWINPSPTLLAAVRGRERWPQLDALARAILTPVDRERFPFRDVVIDQVSASVLAQLDRITDLQMRDAVTSLLAYLLDGLAVARFALVTNLTKGEVLQSIAPLTIDVDAIAAGDFDETSRIVENQLRVLEGTAEDARGYRFRTIGGHIHFAATRVLPIDFDEFVERVDISAGIRFMNDYLGGSWVVVEADDEGRPLRQAERNLYLPQPNWVGAVGGEPIDVEKVERIAYTPDRHDIWWRTVRSANGSAESDDGLVTFARTPADQVEVRVFARQRFRLPTGVAALGVERFPAIHGELVADAYSRFFEGTISNLRAAYEGRPYRIGRPALAVSADPVGSELRAVLSGAFAVITRAFGWAPAGGVTPIAGQGLIVEPLYVDELGFSHFGGQSVPAFVNAATPSADVPGDKLTPMIFLTELGRAVGRDLAALGVPELSGIVATATAARRGSGNPATDWAAAHLGVPPAPSGEWR